MGSRTCLLTLNTAATSLAIDPDGKLLVTGGRNGSLQKWQLSLRDGKGGWKCKGPTPQPQSIELDDGKFGDFVDGVLLLPGDRIAAKSRDGHVRLWSSKDGQKLATMRVPGLGLGMALGSHIRMSTTKTGDFLCIGNNSGTVYIYDALTGARVASLSSDKVKSPVWSCAMSEAGDHVIAATGAGLILRYEYVRNDGECDGMSEKRRDGAAERRDAMEVDEVGT